MFLLTHNLTYPYFKTNCIFNDSEVEVAKKAQKLKQHLYWLGTYNFKTYLPKGMIRKFSLNKEDSVKCDHIYEPNRPRIQGGM